MPIGTVHQTILVKYIPDGLNLTVYDVNPIVPGDELPWYYRIEFVNGSKKTSLPFDVSTTTRNGTLGIVSLSSESAFSYGSYGSFGPKVEIFYRLHGTTKVQNQSFDVDQKGYICVSTTEWGIGRPDYCNVTYQIAGGNPVNLSGRVPSTIATNPKDIQLVFAVNAKDKEIGMNVTVADKSFLDKLIESAIGGVFWGNEKAFGWAIGKFY
ncbi:12323_t:CDS:2 [Ambispora gerdemannii]|uniref:12323_t:CDS:1 n=1 Tax=Ambispora gerdemannii TaxID=144530 RepID=A0A9N9FA00_9GLOM|nr:12323_t:CDS:2 [Ambispora gerdemannii]